jgi:hypothetical protein
MVGASGFSRSSNTKPTRMTPDGRRETLVGVHEQPQSSAQAPTGTTMAARAMNAMPRILLLAALGYLGFYVYGLIMGVFSPGEMLGFTVVAAVCVISAIVHAVRFKRAMNGPDRERITRELQKFRETRGW